jgi:hypothetical protein
MLGRGLCASQEALDFASQVIARLHDALQDDGRSRHLQTCLDGPGSFFLGAPAGTEQVAGVTGWDAEAPPLEQLRAADLLQTSGAAGAVAILLAQPPSVARILDLLRHAWRKTETVRLRLVRLNSTWRQLAARAD